MGQDSISDADRWAMRQLSSNGEDLAGRCMLPQYLLLALHILLLPLGARPPSLQV